MSTRFANWKAAHAAATSRARSTGLDVAIRKVKEFGQTGYNVSFAAWNDSDYALAEIVQPEPRR